MFWSECLLTPVECLTLELQLRFHVFPSDRGIHYAGGVKTTVQTSALPIRDELVVHRFGHIPMPVGVAFFVAILVPVLLGQGLPVEQCLRLPGAVDLDESFHELTIFPATARTSWLVLVPVDLHGEKAFQQSRRGSQIRQPAW